MAASLPVSAFLLGLIGALLLLSSPREVVGQGPGADGLDALLFGGDNYDRVRLILETSTTNSTFSFENVTKVLSDPAYVASRPTVVYMHGYLESRESESVGIVSRAYIQRGSQNFLLVDWGPYAAGLYTTAFFNVPGVGRRVGQAVNDLVRAGLPSDDVWLVGHSLGGEMTHFVSGALDFKPKRISALDPALPLYNLPGYPHLTADDAVLVDVIHTDAGVFGYDRPLGHIDLWPNGGRREQPGCELNETSVEDSLLYCSHHRSYEFFAESVNSVHAFPAVRCGSYEAFLAGECPANDTNIVYLGYDAPVTGQQGNFYLRTAAESPFGLGLQGVEVESESSTTEGATTPASR